jgi:hypothetical protein
MTNDEYNNYLINYLWLSTPQQKYQPAPGVAIFQRKNNNSKNAK